MRGGGAVGAGILACWMGVAGVDGQRPRFGAGLAAGLLLDSELARHEFTVSGPSAPVPMAQEVALVDAALASAHAEWYAARHLAVRARAGWGSGRLEATTAPQASGPEAPPPGHGGGPVRIATLDLGASLWPWRPRSVGFAPFLAAAFGLVRYDFEEQTGARPFRPAARRDRTAFVAGAGADVLIWRFVVLRAEVSGHGVRRPVRAAHFQSPGEVRSGRVSHIRLALGVHVYFPFATGSVENPERRGGPGGLAPLRPGK